MIRNLVAEREIERAMGRYARALDTHNWPLLDSVFTPDVQGIYGGAPNAPGRDAIVAGIRSHLDGCGPSQHLLGNFEVEVLGAEARSLAYVRVYHIGKGEKASRFFETFGEYHAHWRQTGEGWRAYRWELKVTMNLGDIGILGPGEAA